jgi:hypothetical protein
MVVVKMVKIIGNTFYNYVTVIIISSLFAITSINARIRMEIKGEGSVPNQVAVGRPFTLDVVIDEIQGSVQIPIIKGLDDSAVRLVGTYMTNINGKSSVRYSYSIRIDKSGTRMIGPAVAQYQKKELSSEQIRISVVNDLGIPQRENKASAQQPSTQAFLRLMIDTEAPFVGQKIGCTLRFYYQDPSISLQSIGIPEVSGFEMKEISRPEIGKAEIEGNEYHYGQWQWDMYPTKAGEFIVPAYHADYDIPPKDGHHLLSGFFMLMANRVDRKRVYSNAFTIKVLPLPYSAQEVHAVGCFEKYTAEIQPSIAKEGEGMVLTIEVQGKGNLDAIKTPSLQLPDGLKHYDSQNVIAASRHSDELPRKKWEFIIQPMKAGDYEIPEQLFTYFDTEKNAYITLRSSPIAVSILASSLPISKNIPPRHYDVSKQQDEILPIDQHGEWYPHHQRKPLAWWLFIVLFLLPCLSVCYPLMKRVGHVLGNSAGLQRRLTFRHARKKIDYCMQESNDKELYYIFMQLLESNGAVVDGNVSALAIKIKQIDLPDLPIKATEQWDVFFERIKYAAYGQSDPKHADELCRMAQQWLECLEKII